MADGALRSLLGLIADDEAALRLAREGGHAFVSASLRPYLIAALSDRDDQARGRPTLVVVGEYLNLRGALTPQTPPTVEG